MGSCSSQCLKVVNLDFFTPSKRPPLKWGLVTLSCSNQNECQKTLWHCVCCVASELMTKFLMGTEPG